MKRSSPPVAGIHAPAPRVTFDGALIVALTLAGAVGLVLTVGEWLLFG